MEVQDLTMVSVANQAEVLDTLKRGSKNRSVTATSMNDVSSRSHLILSVYVMGRNNITGKDTMGKMHLIDLSVEQTTMRDSFILARADPTRVLLIVQCWFRTSRPIRRARRCDEGSAGSVFTRLRKRIELEYHS